MKRCPHCNFKGEPIYVHGHAQCTVCGTNIDPCCSGEQAQEGPVNLGVTYTTGGGAPSE